jgi:hypothetical protein
MANITQALLVGLLKKWKREAEAAGQLSQSTYRNAQTKELAIELRSQYQSAERTYENCIRDVKRVFGIE